MRFAVGDRVAAYNHRGEKEGNGTVVKSKDRRLLEYIRVRLDGSGIEMYFREDLCKKLVRRA